MDLNNQPAHFLVLPCVNMVKLIPALLDKFDNIKFNKNVTLQIWNLKQQNKLHHSISKARLHFVNLHISVFISYYHHEKSVFLTKKSIWNVKIKPLQRKVKTLTIKFFQTKYFFFGIYRVSSISVVTTSYKRLNIIFFI